MQKLRASNTQQKPQRASCRGKGDGAAMTQLFASEVKGVWFGAMRDYVGRAYGDEMLELMLGKAPLEFVAP